jgi:eukaryotic-like serine/threonine-protein kinase
VTANGAGNEELVVQLDHSAVLSQWTRNGQYLIMDSESFGKSPRGIWAAPMSGAGTPFPVVTGPFEHRGGRVSPDGKWIAYAGEETGRREVYVQEFPPKGAKSQISTAGGEQPKWRADGGELFYREGSKVVSVEVKTNARKLEAGIPKPLVDVPGSTDFDISADGQKFLVVVRNEDPGPPQPFTVVTNWLAGIKR